MDPFCVYANLYEKDIKYNIVMYVKNASMTTVSMVLF